jgi:tetratricopeptide (TPR) repeat protein
MTGNRHGFAYKARYRKKNFFAVMLFVAAAVLVCVLFAGIFQLKSRSGNERQELLGLWEGGDYYGAYEASKEALREKPMDYFLLTLCGFSAYQAGISRINSLDALVCIDDCILVLRKALLLRNASRVERVYYVLGKAYYYKGQGYMDLAVKYLEMARDAGFDAGDIPEYLGLAYAAVRDYRASVAVFSLALRPAEDGTEAPDALLLSIARSYIALEERDAAGAYLQRCISNSRDSRARAAARLLLGEILEQGGDDEGAEAQYAAVLEETGENAEAYFRLGELYNARGDTTRARAEWRRAWRADPAHPGARARL